MGDIEIIKELEKQFDCKFEQISLSEIYDEKDNYFIFNYVNKKMGYCLDNGSIVCLILECYDPKINTDFMLKLSEIKYLKLHCTSDFPFESLAKYKNLKSLKLEAHKDTNLSFLKKLNKLTTLDLAHNYRTDFSFLKELKGLISLKLRGNTIKDISILSEFKQLKWLDLAFNDVANITPLKDLKELTTLDLTRNGIVDATPLSKLKKLTSLTLLENKVSDLAFLKELNELKSLVLTWNKFKDITVLKNLKGLTSLDLTTNNLTDITPLQYLKELTSLILNNNELTDLNPLRECKKLTRLSFSKNCVDDLTFIRDLINLEDIWLDENPITNPPRRVVNEGLLAIREYFGQNATKFVNEIEDEKYSFFIDERDGQKYKTVQIGDQIWMAENLDFATENGSECYSNSAFNSGISDRIYDWHTALEIAPKGWHLPSKDEFDLLLAVVNHDSNALKEVGNGIGDGQGNNSSGFSAKLSKSKVSKNYMSFYQDCISFWSSSQYSNNTACYIEIETKGNSYNWYSHSHDCRFNIRCIKD